MSKTLTQRQAAILTYLRGYIATIGYPPSLREIGDAVHLHSTSSVNHQLQNLHDLGYLRRDPRTPRGLRILPPPDNRSRR